ncbi:DMT family transporter [Lyticum sinuosum]|uniref:S-adenosylmethionine uptake transporter n=1 Tax=Lyticum sinuosum TaxID=1332059 RepID=A0AAE5AI18_9RICK|nr:DMT family transporter [Lyticum sinuosum]MDZ5761479.1 DMT family transporter [Lyticum sinuosum]
MSENSIKTDRFKIICGIFWLIASLIISSLNDVITKKYTLCFNLEQIVFTRFVFGSLSIIPIIIFNSFYNYKFYSQNIENDSILKKIKSSFKTNYIKQHLIRGLLLSISMYFWVNGISKIPLATVTAISFTIPIFLVVLAIIFLKEKANIKIIINIIVGFIGIIIAINPSSFLDTLIIIRFIISAILFAYLDIINKILINKGEKTIIMLFYSNFFAGLFFIIPALNNWKIFNLNDLPYFIILGFGSNIILYCILKAYSLASLTILAPLRYLELIISTIFGYFLFDEKVTINLIFGSIIIVISTINTIKKQIISNI